MYFIDSGVHDDLPQCETRYDSYRTKKSFYFIAVDNTFPKPCQFANEQVFTFSKVYVGKVKSSNGPKIKGFLGSGELIICSGINSWPWYQGFRLL